MAKKLTKKEKIMLVAHMPEVMTAMKILVALMREAKIKKFVQYEYEVEPMGKFRFTLHRIKKSNKKK